VSERFPLRRARRYRCRCVKVWSSGGLAARRCDLHPAGRHSRTPSSTSYARGRWTTIKGRGRCEWALRGGACPSALLNTYVTLSRCQRLYSTRRPAAHLRMPAGRCRPMRSVCGSNRAASGISTPTPPLQRTLMKASFTRLRRGDHASKRTRLPSLAVWKTLELICQECCAAVCASISMPTSHTARDTAILRPPYLRAASGITATSVPCMWLHPAIKLSAG
jgi:hypothetical protein